MWYGYSAASLLAIAFAIPFGLRVLIHRESGGWTYLPQAFYHAHLELFLGNACLGVGVMMLLALTVERYASVCRPGRRSPPPPLAAPPHRARAAAFLIPVITFVLYLPNVFRAQLTRCITDRGALIYQKRDNTRFLHSLFYSVYKCALELMFKVAPTLLLAGLNLRIMVVYRRSCERRRKMTLKPSGEDSRKFAEERRLVLLLGSTSILFFVCVSPMAILNVTLSEVNLNNYSYQVFRAIANVLEVANYSITFYIYCLFSEDFRNTLIRTFRSSSCCSSRDSGHNVGSKTALPPARSSRPSGGRGGCGGRGSTVLTAPCCQAVTQGPSNTTTTTTTTTPATAAGGAANVAGDTATTCQSTCLQQPGISPEMGGGGWRNSIGVALRKASTTWRGCGCRGDSACVEKEASPGGSSADRVIV
ncbi:probable G-protein coupled receptor B0563.6 [Ischnura elegans]|uniref:probable G-protein coupled receptor B0563.6 n=1 Tax=Ischnura elegans TaxID=197161 RepID=UPI001ED89687|nr:probable G-protein coupled receptor B0563.6 [Ischnura elegans]